MSPIYSQLQDVVYMWQRVQTCQITSNCRNAAARSLSIVASALGIPALLPFLEEICFKMESWEARHTGVMIVYHITVLIGSANLLPYLSYLMEIVEPRLKDDIEKIRDVTNVAMDALAIAATLWY
ncbi:splicing factor 3B subunit 1-like isoform X2 [Solanum pennellii]|uniref:Splicing factor 3B subunit 1-like isoform X2 n=1 Tax=Solanum pennellii TaxID=28526 RepID=A0ABM1UWH3_SOLPN|nr:splicing factor 3B subunit 1-like isoform X2 [Solanum pennellii]